MLYSNCVNIFHRSNKKNTYIPKIEINNLKIDRVSKFDFLGVILDENLNWKDHINKISTKISRVIGILCKMKNFMPPFIVPHLTYGILVWGSNTSYLFKLQKKAIRTITKSKYNEHTEPLFKMLNLLKIQDLFKLTVLKFYYNKCHTLLPAYFQAFNLSQRASHHPYNIRTKFMLHINKTNKKLSDIALRNMLPKLINETDSIILDKIFTHSFHEYTFYVKQYMINNYNAACTIDNCYICNQ